MASKTTWLLLFIYLSLTTHFASVTPQTTTFQASGCIRNNQISSSFISDLNTLLPSLSSNIGNSGFQSDSLNGAYAAALCRADILLSQCRNCVSTLEQAIQRLGNCPLPQSQAIMYTQDCMVRYSNGPILGRLATWSSAYFRTSGSIASPDEFNRSRGTLFDELRVAAANGGAQQKAAAGNRSAESQTVYALAQCTPDLSTQDCSDCLEVAISNISQCCGGWPKAGEYNPNCNLRYDTQLFYDTTRVRELTQELSIPPSSSTPPSPSSPSSNSSSPPSWAPTPGSSDGNKSRNITITVISITVILIVALCVGVGIFARKRMRMKQKPKLGDPESIKQEAKAESRKQEPNGDQPESMKPKTKEELELGKDGNGMRSFESPPYDFDTIRAATNNFSDANKLGEGGFGAVYKGKLQNGDEIAVKRLSKTSDQGDEQFKNEALFLTQLQHRNLVKLLGFSLEGTERLLVYEFVQNGSLHSFISDPINYPKSTWETRSKIIRGVAKGLHYLHEDSRVRIIHRDLKASNVLLDKEMYPKISDFGLAKLVVRDATHERTNRIIGTSGYMAPEYVNGGEFSFKSDVFAFGVLVLEIVTSERIGSQNEGNPRNLLSRAWEHWNGSEGATMIDASLMVVSGAKEDMLRCFHIALLCVQRNPSDRPKMDGITQMLNGFPPTLPRPLEPGFYIPPNFYAQELKMSSEKPLLNHQAESANV